MEITISNDVLGIRIDESARIEKTVSGRPASSSKNGKNKQGSIYIHCDYIGQTCMFLLTEPTDDHATQHEFTRNGESCIYYDSVIREIRAIKTSEKYATGITYLPYYWIGKKVIGIVFAE